MLYSRSILLGFAVLALGAAAMEVAPPRVESSDPFAGEKTVTISDWTSKGHSEVEIPVESLKVTRSITVMNGSLSDFTGEDILELGETAWFTFDGARTSLILALGDSTLVAYHSNRAEPTVATFVNVDPMSEMAWAMEAAEGGFPCGPEENLCVCSVSAEDTCNGIAMLTVICCPAGQFCTCKTLIGETGCIIGIRAACLEPPE